jgi:hypothetical protein
MQPVRSLIPRPWQFHLCQVELCRLKAAPDPGALTQCAVGSASNSTTCIFCGKGKFSNVTGASSCLSCDKGTSAETGASSCFTLPWNTSTTMIQFDNAECTERRTWEHIVRNSSVIHTTGGLRGSFHTVDFTNWACFSQHPCIAKFGGANDDSMCFVYDETRSDEGNEPVWMAWGLNSQLQVSGTCSTVSTP